MGDRYSPISHAMVTGQNGGLGRALSGGDVAAPIELSLPSK